jgi:dolichol-phosphate mannosyltransferase
VENTEIRTSVSVAAPAHNEVDALPELHRRLAETMQKVNIDWELVIADDGSTDGTRELLRQLVAGDPNRVRAVFLSRNFGHTPAYMAALAQSSGKWTVLMDADLQDEPEVIPRMIEKAEEGYDVVYAVKKKRPESAFMRFAFSTYYRVAGRFSSVDQPPGAGPFCLMSHRAVTAVLAMPERSLFFPGIRSYVGYPQAGIPVDRPERLGGSSRITLRRRVSGALDGIFAFSTAPLRFAAVLGVAVAGTSALLELFFLYFKLFTDVPVQGLTTIIVLFLFLGGVQLLTVGIIGEYLGRVYEEVKHRPRYVVQERLNLGDETSDRGRGAEKLQEPVS